LSNRLGHASGHEDARHAPLYAGADRQGWLVGETLEQALAALRRKLAGHRMTIRPVPPLRSAEGR
jgi:hypothetical protein